MWCHFHSEQPLLPVTVCRCAGTRGGWYWLVWSRTYRGTLCEYGFWKGFVARFNAPEDFVVLLTFFFCFQMREVKVTSHHKHRASSANNRTRYQKKFWHSARMVHNGFLSHQCFIPVIYMQYHPLQVYTPPPLSPRAKRSEANWSGNTTTLIFELTEVLYFLGYLLGQESAFENYPGFNLFFIPSWKEKDPFS